MTQEELNVYKMRAQEIREKYPKVFNREKIEIDEAVLFINDVGVAFQKHLSFTPVNRMSFRGEMLAWIEQIYMCMSIINTVVAMELIGEKE